MKLFKFHPLLTNPVGIARRDYLEFFVEKVLGMTGVVKRVHTLNFHMKWVGYDHTHKSFEPWKNVRDVAVLHDYLNANDLGRLIPKKFK